MSDRLFQLEQEIQRLREQAQSGLSAAQAYEDTPQTNRLLALQQSVTEAMAIQSQANPYTTELSESSTSQAYVINWEKPDGVAIHKFQRGSPDIVRSGGILGTGIATRVKFGDLINVNWGKVASNPNYVWCQYKDKEGYIRKDHITKDGKDTVEKIIEDQVMCEIFKAFLEQEFAAENINFMLAYKDTEEFNAANRENINAIANRRCQLIENYILNDLINISSAAKIAIKTVYDTYKDPRNTAPLKINTFLHDIKIPLSQARDEIVVLIAQDVLRRFFPAWNDPSRRKEIIEKPKVRDALFKKSLQDTFNLPAEDIAIQSTANPYTASLSQFEYSQPFADDLKSEFTYTCVINWQKPSGVAIHKFNPGSPDVVRSGGILGTGIATRVQAGTIIQVAWNKVASDPNYVKCRYENTEGYIRKDHIFQFPGNISITMSSVIENPIMCVGFRKFLETQFATENLDFLLAYKALEEERVANRRSSIEIANQALQLIRDYILSSSPKEINISSPVRKEITNAYNTYNPTTVEMFLENMDASLSKAQKEIKDLINTDPGKRFLIIWSDFKNEVLKEQMQRQMQAKAEIMRVSLSEQALRNAGLI